MDQHELTEFTRIVRKQLHAACIDDTSRHCAHTHPPMRRLVAGCDYCALYGNVLCE